MTTTTTSKNLTKCMVCGSTDLYESFDGPTICAMCEASHVQGVDGKWFGTDAATVAACRQRMESDNGFGFPS